MQNLDKKTTSHNSMAVADLNCPNAKGNGNRDDERKDGSEVEALAHWRPELKRQVFGIALPTSAERMLSRVQWMLTLHILGYQTSSVELAAAALASTLANVLGISIIIGMCSGMTTLVGQARGASAQALASSKSTSENSQKEEMDALEAMEIAEMHREHEHELSSLSSDQTKEEAQSDWIPINQHTAPSTISEHTPLLNDGTHPSTTHPSRLSTYGIISVDNEDNRQGQEEHAIAKELSKKDILYVYLYRGIFVHLLYALPMGIIWMTPGAVSHLLVEYGGQDPTVAQLCERYLCLITPGFWMYTIHLSVGTWLQSMEIAHIPPMVTLVAVILHPFLLFTLVPWLGYDGAPYAACFFLSIQPILLIGYLCTREGHSVVHNKITNVTATGEDQSLPNTGVSIQNGTHLEDEDLTIRRSNLSNIIDGERRPPIPHYNSSPKLAQESQQQTNEENQDFISVDKSVVRSSTTSTTTTTTIRHHLRLVKQAVCSWHGIQQYMALSLPGVVLISEWWASEVSIFLSGHLTYNGLDDLGDDTMASAVPLAAFSIYQSLNTFCFSLAQGFGVAASTRVGNELGSQHVAGAKMSAMVASTASLCTGVMVSIFLLGIPNTLLPSWYDPHPPVYETCAQTMPWLAFYVIGDALAFTFTGIIKGCGRQQVVVPIVVVAYWLVGLPIGVALTFTKRFLWFSSNDSASLIVTNVLVPFRHSLYGSITGLVAGLTIGTWIHMLILGLVVIQTDWRKESDKAKARVQMQAKALTK
jgi:Na+-driven multidrug efflux pump